MESELSKGVPSNGTRDTSELSNPRMTVNPGWAYCPDCNELDDWQTGMPNCPKDGICKGRALLPIPTTLACR
jgi:hypothetical protein